MKFKNTKDVASVIKDTQKDNQSNDNFEVADGLQIRLKPVYPDKAK